MKARRPAFSCRCLSGAALWVRHGCFYRTSDSRRVCRWKCLRCKKTCSQATLHPCFRQKKRRANHRLFLLLASGVSLRRAARILGLNRTTIERKFRFLASQSRKANERFLERFQNNPLSEIVFDEMETFEQTKFKPLSIALAVSPSRQILSTQVAQMPATGLLAAKSRKKYGFRKDQRPAALNKLFETLVPITKPNALFKSDQKPTYPIALKRVFPNARHITTKGGRAAVVGQGELKKLTWDPIFALNHSAAMLRANMNRLFRRTWCTTKKPAGLENHLAIYIHYHNSSLLQV